MPQLYTAPAKINLYLHVTGRRDDGYHLLDSLVAFAGIKDSISAKAAPAPIRLSLQGSEAKGLPAGQDNLVLKAAHLLQKTYKVPAGAELTLTKRLPIASGIGGGSADAAATLKALAALWKINVSNQELQTLGLQLGADVPVCVHGKAVFMGGIGEKLTPAPKLPQTSIVLVNPRVPLSTPAVFAKRREMVGDSFSKDGKFDYTPNDAGELAAILASRSNDLCDAACALQPEIRDVLNMLEAIPGCLLARMSGSGATCFGLFEDSSMAIASALGFSKSKPEWWAKAASLESDAERLQPR